MSSHTHYCPVCNRRILCAVSGCSGIKQKCGACGKPDFEAEVAHGEAHGRIDHFDAQQEALLFPYTDIEA